MTNAWTGRGMVRTYLVRLVAFQAVAGTVAIARLPKARLQTGAYRPALVREAAGPASSVNPWGLPRRRRDADDGAAVDSCDDMMRDLLNPL